MTEQQLQKKIINRLEELGFYVFKVVSANKRGVPDIIGLSPKGRFVAVEVKAPNKPEIGSPLQEYNLAVIRSKNGIGIVANNLGKVEEVLKKEGLI